FTMFRLCQNFCEAWPVRATAYVEKTLLDRFQPWSAPDRCASDYWSLRDVVCWPGRPPQETTRESSCWLCCDDNSRRCADRLGCIAAAAVALGRRLRHREAGDGAVPRSPWPRPSAPRQGLTLCVCGRSRGGGVRCPWLGRRLFQYRT